MSNKTDYWNKSSIASDLTLIDIANYFGMSYELTPSGHRIDARMSITGRTERIIYYNYYQDLVYNWGGQKLVLPPDTFSFSKVNYTCKMNDILVEHKSCSVDLDTPFLRQGFFFELDKFNALVLRAQKEKRRPIIFYHFKCGTLLIFDALLCEKKVGHYWRQIHTNDPLTQEKTNSPCFKLLPGSHLLSMQMNSTDYYYQKAGTKSKKELMNK